MNIKILGKAPIKNERKSYAYSRKRNKDLIGLAPLPAKLWMKTIETSIDPEVDHVYISISSNSNGCVQKTDDDAIKAKASFRSGVKVMDNGEKVVLVSFFYR
jgi:hypothetical protein